MELTIEQALQQAVAAHKEGRLQDAERLYRAILESQPRHPDANHNLGVLAVSVNKGEAALPLLKAALEANPKMEQFWLSYIDALIKVRQFDNAEQVIEEARKQGVSADRLNTLAAHLASNPQKPTVGVHPPQELINELLGHYQSGMFAEAEKLALSITQDYPKHSFGWKVLGAVLKQTGRVIASLTVMEKSVKIAPQDAEAHNNLGTTLKELGRLDEAEASYNQAIALKADLAEAHRMLASMKKFKRQDEQYSKMLELYLDGNITEEQRCHINFGLAKACEDLGNFEQAFTHYSEGNEIRKKLLNYDINQDVRLFRQIKSNYQRIKDNSLQPDKLSTVLTQVFIVGMPRSGTTLVEQIISAHPQVTDAGELPYASQFGAAIASGFSEVNNQVLLDFRQKYLAKLRNVCKGSHIVTDKMPQNFLYIGLLAAAFPEARILHVKRNPAAVCWANYKQYFESKSIGYCYAIDDVISYHKLYEDLMDFWTTALPNRIYKLDYELLTVNQESETRQLIEYLGLDWDENCLSPQNNTRSVATASNLQVRQKVYKGSSEQWKKYQPFLNGVLDDLLSQ